MIKISKGGMMNIVKVQTEILKRLIKRLPVVWVEEQDRIGVGDGTYMVYIPADDFYLDLKSNPYKDKREILKCENKDYFLAEFDSFFEEIINRKKYTLIHLKDDNGRSTFIDKKYTAYFDKDAMYYIRSPREPVMVMEDNVKVGVIFPVISRRAGES